MSGGADARAQATDAALAARERVGAPTDRPITDLVLDVERAFGLAVVIMPLPAGTSGAYVRKAGTAFAFVSAADAPVRRRFTLAHELGHHLLGHGDRHDTGATLAMTEGSSVESAANRFASEFLAPAAGVRAFLADDDGGRAPTLESVCRLAHRYGISAHAACIRLRTAGLVDDARFERLREEIVEQELHLDLARTLGLGELDDTCARVGRPGGARLPGCARHSALAPFLDGALSAHELAAALGRDPGEVERAFEA